MSSSLSAAEVARIAALAHLELTAEEQERFARQLASILTYVERIGEVDTTGVPATAHVAVEHSVFRADEIRASLPRADALANAPEADHTAGLFKVPRVLG